MKITSIVAVVALAALVFVVVPAGAASGNLKLSVTVSPADGAGVVEPALSPWKTPDRVINRFKGYSETMTLDGDLWLKSQNGKVVKATLRVQNVTKEKQSLPLPLLRDVILRSAGATHSALSFLSSSGLVVGMEGKSSAIELAPGESVELLYYVPSFHGAATIEVAGLGTSAVRAP